ncbi:MAG: sugar phosphate isomerase/epimerase [Candidatus Hydrogenedentes bacterium]|nr:sugar phosphate isomerase/epimerase [Candidatus Hydrogenedentota bacterium]
MKVGIILGSLGTGSLKRDLQRAMAIGVHGIQLWVVDNELDPRELSGSGREELADYMESLGLECTALCGDVGGFADLSVADERIARTKSFIDLCVDLKTPILTTHIGTVPDDASSRAYQDLANAVREVSEYAVNRGCCLAIETGPESAESLAGFIAAVKSDGTKVNYDPANLCMNGFDHIGGVKTLAPYIVHTHAKDGVYESGKHGKYQEVPLGKGDVNFPRYLAALRDISYTSFLTIEREHGDDPAADIVEAVTFLKRQEGVEP